MHGSEFDSALDTYALQGMFPAQGIGAFVYDKRGTGASGGTYTQNFNVLSGDAVAAMNEAKRLTGSRLGRIGYQGGSEGGWVVPLAANRAHVDFAIVSFGLAVTVLEEDQESVALDMYFHHDSAADTAKALELARAGEHFVATGGKQDYEKFDMLRQKYKSEPWYKDVHGDFLFFILPLDEKQIFDAAAPSAETAKRIKALIADGKQYTLAVYPDAEHGMTEYELNAKGDRVSTRFAPGYFQMMADFIRDGRIGEHYGNAEITQPKSR